MYILNLRTGLHWSLPIYNKNVPNYQQSTRNQWFEGIILYTLLKCGFMVQASIVRAVLNICVVLLMINAQEGIALIIRPVALLLRQGV